MNDKQLYAIISEMKTQARLHIHDMLEKGTRRNGDSSAYHRAEGYAAGFNGAIQMLERLAMDAELDTYHDEDKWRGLDESDFGYGGGE